MQTFLKLPTRNTEIVVRFIPFNPSKAQGLFIPIESSYVHPITNKRIPRYVYAVIVRGRENEGVKLFSVSKWLHQRIIDGIVENPVKPHLSLRMKLLQWMLKLKLVRWLGISRRVHKYLPQSTNALDLKRGYDFKIICKIKYGYPDYGGSHFVTTSCPLGSDEQVRDWLEQANKIVIPPRMDDPAITTN